MEDVFLRASFEIDDETLRGMGGNTALAQWVDEHLAGMRLSILGYVATGQLRGMENMTAHVHHHGDGVTCFELTIPLTIEIEN